MHIDTEGVKPSLRLYPALPYMERVATKADTIPLGRPVKLTDNETLSQLRISPGQVRSLRPRAPTQVHCVP